MGRRLVTADQVAGWETQLRDAMTKAADRQRRTVGDALTAHGLTWESETRDTAGDLWSQAEWSSALMDEVGPVARKIAAEIVSTLNRAVPASRGWGLSDAVDQLAQRPIDRALAGGPRIGGRLSRSPVTAAGVDVEDVQATVGAAPDRYGGVVHDAARQTVADAYQAAVGQLNDLVARVSSAMGNEATAILSDSAQQNTGATLQHQWSAVGDEATRETHADADGQTVDVGDSFTVGDEELLYPGDPSGSDAETCNCRCWLEVIGLEDVPAATDTSEEDAAAG